MDPAHSADACWRLDRLASELSSSLARVPADEVGFALADAVRRIGEELDIDRVVLADVTDGDDTPDVHRWTRDGRDDDPLGSLIQAARLSIDPVVCHRPVADLFRIADGELSSDVLCAPSIASAAAIPITVSGAVRCVLAVGADLVDRPWPDPIVGALRLLGEILGTAWHRQRQALALRRTREESERLTARLSEPRQIPHVAGFADIVGDSVILRGALTRVTEVASNDTTVLLLGETGTGKELFARALHARSARRHAPIVAVNCAALPTSLIESELFGHERGAFTGAVSLRQGRFELAHRGTLFLDEVGDLPLDVQAKLLRVLQEGEFERVGSSHTRRVDVRIIAATHRDLGEAVADGTFRVDLYYRLSVFPIRLPALRQRPGDIPALVWHIIQKRQSAMGRRITHVPPEVMDALQRYSWPGNVRELENVVERGLIHSTADTLLLLEDDLELAEVRSAAERTTLSSVERAHIEDVLRACGGRINGTGNAAERLGVHPNTLRHRMKKLGIARHHRLFGPGMPSMRPR